MFSNQKVKLCVIGLMLLFSFSTKAQLLSPKKTFTIADTLRGTLSPARSCYDVKFYDLKVQFDTASKAIKGSNSIYFTVVADFDQLQLDLAENLRIESIRYGSENLQFSREYNAVFIQFKNKLKTGEKAIITVTYSGIPIQAKRAPWDGGFVWSKNKEGKPWMAVACEGLGASAWWPCKDHASDEPDSLQITCIVATGMKAVCNGNLRSEIKMDNNFTAFAWFVSYPINLYNVTFNIGDYVHWSDTLLYSDNTSLALDYYVMPYNLERSKKQFEQVKPMLLCYEKYLGKYPFQRDGYALVETPYLGMEHQGAIAYGNKYRTGYDGKDFSGVGLDFDYIIIHETGHEWWGNSVSCQDMADMWIHEGFCTYTESIYVECLHGKDKAQDYINAKKKSISNLAPIQGPYGVNEEGDGDMYNKGMLMLNTLRTVVNDDNLWWQTIKAISDTVFKLKTTNAAELIAFFETQTKLNLHPFFAQYLQHAAIPKLVYTIQKKGKKKYMFNYRWETDVVDFEMPLLLYIHDKPMFVKASNKLRTKVFKIDSTEQLRIDENKLYIKAVRQL